MSKMDWVYTAGLIDGEGTITLCQHYTYGYRTPRVSVASTTMALMRYLRTTFGGCISTKRTYKAHHKASYAWTLSGHKALDFCETIFPHLKEPVKRRRAKFLAANYLQVTKRNGRYLPPAQRRKEKFERDFFLL